MGTSVKEGIVTKKGKVYFGPTGPSLQPSATACKISQNQTICLSTFPSHFCNEVLERIVDEAKVKDCKTLGVKVHLTDSGPKKRWQPLCHERHRRELNVGKFFRETRRGGEEARKRQRRRSKHPSVQQPKRRRKEWRRGGKKGIDLIRRWEKRLCKRLPGRRQHGRSLARVI